MNERPKTQEEPRTPAGVIACLTSGFEIVAHTPQLLLPAVLLDLFLWLGPRLSAQALFEPLITMAKTPPTADMQSLYQALAEALTGFVEGFNLFAVLNPGPLLGTPTLMGARLTLESPLGPRIEIPVPTLYASLGWIAVLIILGLGISAVYLAQIGRQVADSTEAPTPGPVAPHRLWGQLLRLTLALLFFLGGAGFSASLLIGVGAAISQSLAGLVSMFVLSLSLFILLHFIYTIPGMVQLRHAPLRAMQESILLVRVDFPGAVQLLMLALILIQGLNFVWTLPATDTWAAAVGIGGHAVVSTALTAALFIFYQERLAYLRLLQSAFAAKLAQATQ